MSSDANAGVRVSRSGRLGRITLDRPQTLNALTLEMVLAIDRALTDFADPAVTTVLIDGAGERGLCAGGDIRAIYDAILRGDPSPREFWREEYRLNARLAQYPKPIVALMDGVVMGGGVGVGAHTSLRVVTERSVVAMPEVGIGFGPDVGSTWLLSRAPGQLGTHIALSAVQLGGADAITCGLADYHVPSASLPTIIEALTSDDPRDTVTAAAKPPPPGAIQSAVRSWIDHCYSADRVEDIVDRLRECASSDAHAAADMIATKSPTSLKVTLRALRTARALPTLEACLDMEYQISTTFLDMPDFAEGIRAAVIDKDRRPKWAPDRLDQVSDSIIDRFFGRPGSQLRRAKAATTRGEARARSGFSY